MTLCRWCREHPDTEPCQKWPALGTILVDQSDPSPFDPAADLAAVSLRMIAFRTSLKAHQGYAHSKGFEFPECIRNTDPDVQALSPEPEL